MTIISDAGGINANLAPDTFHRWAEHYYICRQSFKSPHKFSPVPFFLLCRCIELELKSRFLKINDQNYVKKRYRHCLCKAYKDLPNNQKILEKSELDVLCSADQIYKDKGFEYFGPEDALTGFKRYPDIKLLDSIACKLLKSHSQ